MYASIASGTDSGIQLFRIKCAGTSGATCALVPKAASVFSSQCSISLCHSGSRALPVQSRMSREFRYVNSGGKVHCAASTGISLPSLSANPASALTHSDSTDSCVQSTITISHARSSLSIAMSNFFPRGISRSHHTECPSPSSRAEYSAASDLFSRAYDKKILIVGTFWIADASYETTILISKS